MTEFASALLHLIGAVVFLTLTPNLLAQMRHDRTRFIGACFYVFSITFILAMSGLYHMSEFVFGSGTPTTETFRQLDHIGIWLAMAGSCIPPHLICFRGAWRWVPLGLVSGGAFIGVLTKVFFFGSLPLMASFVFYVSVGSIAFVSVFKLYQLYGWSFVRGVAYGLVFFGTGAVFFVMRPSVVFFGMIGHHEVWHIGVLAGCAFHWHFVLKIADFETPGLQTTPATRPEPSTAVLSV